MDLECEIHTSTITEPLPKCSLVRPTPGLQSAKFFRDVADPQCHAMTCSNRACRDNHMEFCGLSNSPDVVSVC